MPSRQAVALVPLVVGCVDALGVVGAGVGGAGSEHFSTGGAVVGQITQAGEAGHTIHTGAGVQTRT